MKKLILMLSLMLGIVLLGFGIPLTPGQVSELKSKGEFERVMKIINSAKLRGLDQPQRKTINIMKDNGADRVTGTWKALIILVQFPDNLADTVSHGQTYYNTFFFSEGVMPTKSVREYYQEVSVGQFDLTGTIAGWYMMPQNYTYYTDVEYGFGDYPNNAQKLVEDAIAAANPDVDFSQFDNDGDGYVDALFVIHAGGEGAGGNGWAIWSHAWGINQKMYDGVWVSGYSMEPETGKIGVYCHEFGHVLGLPDLYDYGYDSAGVGKFCLMAAGSHGSDVNHPETPSFMNPWCRYTLGWLEPTNVTANLTAEELVWGMPSQDVYRVWTKGVIGPEYFLVENRRKGTSFDKYLPTDGILIYHVDERMSNNDNQNHKLVDIEEASGFQHLDNFSSYGDAGDYYPGTLNNRTFDVNSEPDSKNYYNQNTYVAVFNVSDAGDTMTADIKVYEPAKAPTNVILENYGSGTQAMMKWDSRDEDTNYRVFYGTSPVDLTDQFMTTENSVILTGLSPDTTYYAKVKAYNDFAWSPDSAVKNAFIFDALPGIPQNLKGESSFGEIGLKWEKVLGYDIKGYNIYYKDEYSEYQKLNTALIKKISHSVTGLLPFRRYSFYVTALDSTGHESSGSNEVTLQVLTEVKYFIRNNVLNFAEGEEAVYIDLSLFSDTRLTIALYSINGEFIKNIVDERISAGTYTYQWPGDNSKGTRVSSGVYILHIKMGFNNYIEKVVVLK
ncbi:MAG: M6 family metalloprotease domain-containing protein [bacterium]|nr:M6 family metalloprotease domain-containing protein [bacterium]